MALQDICGFRGSATRHKFNLPLSALDSDVVDDGSLGWRDVTPSGTTEATPLRLFVPSPPNSARPPGRHPPPVTPSTSALRPFPLSHGTTTLGFIFQGGVIAAADTRASAAGLVCSPNVHKITAIHSHLVVTSSGSSADCMLWERILTRELRLYQLRHGRRLSISGTAKLLSYMLHPFKGTDVCVALTLCGWDTGPCTEGVNMSIGSVGSEDALEQTDVSNGVSAACVMGRVAPSTAGGPKVIYVCSDGTRLQGDLFSVGSGSPYAYGVLDGGISWDLSQDEAVSLAREAVYRATHRDAYSGNNVDLYHITARGWRRRQREDLRETYYTEKNELKKNKRQSD